MNDTAAADSLKKAYQKIKKGQSVKQEMKEYEAARAQEAEERKKEVEEERKKEAENFKAALSGESDEGESPRASGASDDKRDSEGPSRPEVTADGKGVKETLEFGSGPSKKTSGSKPGAAPKPRR